LKFPHWDLHQPRAFGRKVLLARSGSDESSASYTIKRQFTVQYDYATNTEKDTGIIYTVSAPGVGLLFHDVGNIGEDDTTFEFLYIHGPHDVATNGDVTFCNALLAIS